MMIIHINSNFDSTVFVSEQTEFRPKKRQKGQQNSSEQAVSKIMKPESKGPLCLAL